MRLLAVAMLLCLASSATAQPNGWVDRLQNQSGGVCCYDSDGRRLDDPEWRTVGNGYEVLFTEGWAKVPPEAMVQQRNQDGIARVWSTWEVGRNGAATNRFVRCFLPGSFG